MKRFFEKHDLFKIAFICLLFVVFLSWICKSAYYNQGSLVTNEITRVGLMDLSVYGLLGFSYVPAECIFIIIICGFYKFLGSIKAYQQLTDKIAKCFNGKELIFVVISMLVIGVFSSLSTSILASLMFIPFFMSILSKMKVDKISAFAATFGGAMLGIIGATYSSYIAGMLADQNYGYGISYGYSLFNQITIFVFGYACLLFFTSIQLKKNNNESVVDVFAAEANNDNTKKAKVNSTPLAIVLAIFAVIFIIAYIGWSSALGVTCFETLHEELMKSEIMKSILGSSSYVVPLGSWNLFHACGLMLIFTLIIKVMYRIPLDKVLDEYLEGIKKSFKYIVIYLLLIGILLITYLYPTIPGLLDNIVGLGKNVGTIFSTLFINSAFCNDFQIVIYQMGSAFIGFGDMNLVGLATQMAYGIVSFVTPTSVLLMLGLSMFDIKYKDWFKYIWKFILIMILIAIIILAVL